MQKHVDGCNHTCNNRVWLHLNFMSEPNQSKVVVLLTDEEHAELKRIAAESRRTLGQELAYRAFRAITLPTGPKRALRGKASRKGKEAA